jgi:hypothetical protein
MIKGSGSHSEQIGYREQITVPDLFTWGFPTGVFEVPGPRRYVEGIKPGEVVIDYLELFIIANR